MAKSRDDNGPVQVKVHRTVTTDDHKVFFRGNAVVNRDTATKIGVAVKNAERARVIEQEEQQSRADLEAQIRAELETKIRAEVAAENEAKAASGEQGGKDGKGTEE